MNRIHDLLIAACLLLLLLSASALGQSRSEPEPAVSKTSFSRTAATVPVIVVSSAGKAVWATTKFGVKQVALPILKATITKAVPKATVFLLKTTVRTGGKLSLAYLKTKLPV